MSETLLSRVDADMRALVDAGEFAGVATEAWHRDELIHRSAYGMRDLASEAPMRPDTIVRAFSMTKPVTAVAMMILHERGLWQPEDPISRHLPELGNLQVFEGLDAHSEPVMKPASNQPTMAQLMTHSAGFAYGFDAGWLEERYREADLWNAMGLADFVVRVADLPLAYDPGSRWHYSISMDLQGAIIERLSGVPFATFVKNRILQPLRMVDTDFHVPTEKKSRLATLYAFQDGALRPVPNPLGDSFETSPKLAVGGGGLYSTAIDYARFGRMLLLGGCVDKVRIVSPDSVAVMMRSHVTTAIVDGGYGIGFQQIRPGYEFGYNGVVVTDPKTAGVVVGAGTYLWDGLASTWFWVDPAKELVFVGMVQRVADPDVPLVQPISQAAVYDDLLRLNKEL